MRAGYRSGALLAGAALFVLSGGLATAQNTKQSATTAGDSHFAREAASGGMLEVQLGQLAVQKSSNDRVKQFGQRMIDDHKKAGDELKNVASKDNISLPGAMSAKDKATYDSLSKLSGTAFDRAYMKDMVKDHTMDVSSFQKEANSGSNADLKTFAGNTLPTLQDHLKQARETNDSLGARSSR